MIFNHFSLCNWVHPCLFKNAIYVISLEDAFKLESEFNINYVLVKNWNAFFWCVSSIPQLILFQHRRHERERPSRTFGQPFPDDAQPADQDGHVQGNSSTDPDRQTRSRRRRRTSLRLRRSVQAESGGASLAGILDSMIGLLLTFALNKNMIIEFKKAATMFWYGLLTCVTFAKN